MQNRFKPIYNNGVFPDTPVSEIQRELQWYKDNGYGGFAVNGNTPKLIDDVNDWLPGYLRSVKNYCSEAKRIGLDMWIFDEWGYPSGCACGLVLTPDMRPKKLHKAIDLMLGAGECVDLPVPERLLSVGVFPVNRFAPYYPEDKADILEPKDGRIRYMAARNVRLVAVTWEPHSFITHVMKNYKEGDPTIGTTDIIDRACVRKFLDNMHERYVPVIGDEFGKTVKGFFYDEPEICWNLPFTPELPKHFMKRHGYDIRTILPEIVTFLDTNCGCPDDGVARNRMKDYYDDYTDAWTSLLAENFYGQIEDWCHEHHLLSVGHQDLDNHAETLVTVSGDFWRNSARNDHPGVDVIWDNIFPDHFDDFARFAGSVKRALNKGGAMSETFAEMGDCMPPDVMRFTMEQQILRGIDQFFLYTFHNSKPQKDPNVGLYTRALMERTEKTAAILNEGKPRAQVAVLVPLSEIAFERTCLNPHQINATPLPWERLDRLAEALCYAPIDFDYAWEEGLDGLYDRGIRCLVLTGNRVKPEAVEGVKAFIAAGGKVYSAFTPCGQLPEVPFVASVRQLVDLLPREVKMAGNCAMVSMASRTLEDGVLYALLNESEAECEARVTFPEEVAVLDTQSGEWRKWNGECVFRPLELKVFRTGIAADKAEVKGETAVFAPWTLNGKPIDGMKPWTELGLAGYTGAAVYESEFDWKGGRGRLELGEVGFAACVKVDGKEYDMPFSPWSCALELPAGHHAISITVVNSEASRAFAENPRHRWSFEQSYLRCGLLREPALYHVTEA